MQWRRRCVHRGLALLVGLVCLGLVSEARAVVVSEDAKLVPTDGADGDQFGYSLAFDGNRVAMGARMHNSQQGAAYLFEPNGSGGYTQIKQFIPADSAVGDMVGSSVVISGDLAVVGGYKADVMSGLETLEDAGAVWVFQKDAGGTGNWGQVAKLTAATPVASASFGASMAIDGNTLLVCAQNETYGGQTNAGAAYLFQNDGLGNWTQIQRIEPSDFDYKDYFGQSCGLDDDTLAIGAHGGNKAYVFQDDGTGNWVEKKILTAEGTSYMGTGTVIQGDAVVVGAYRTTVEGVSQAGTAYVFNRDEGGEDNWGQVAQLLPSDGPQASGHFGVGNAIDGDKIVIGAQGQDGQGAAYVYGKSGGTWIEIAKLVVSDGAAGDKLGCRTALVGDTAVGAASAVLGGPLGFDAIGAVYTFTTPGIPTLVPGDTDGDLDVDADDAEVLAGHWGETVTAGDYTSGDFNGDGVVDAADASILAANWGYHGTTESCAVPEPGTFALLLAGMIWLAAVSRRGRKE